MSEQPPVYGKKRSRIEVVPVIGTDNVAVRMPRERWQELAMFDEVLEALINTVNQACQVKVEDGKWIMDHMALSTYEDALFLLERMGYAREIGHRQYELFWVKQDERMTRGRDEGRADGDQGGGGVPPAHGGGMAQEGAKRCAS